MSRNFTADVDTQREYFNATYYNNSGETQNAKYDTTLLKPFFNDPDKWKLAINRMRIPLSGIPLTKNNIPFEQWQVGLSYQNNGQNAQLLTSYVQQLNPASANAYLTYNLTPQLDRQEIESIVPFTVQNNITLSGSTITGDTGGFYVQPCYDNYNADGIIQPTMYCLANDFKSINCYRSYRATPIANLEIPNFTLPDNHVSCMCTDTVGNLYVAYTSVDNDGNEIPNVQSFNRTTYDTWSVSTLYVYGGLSIYFNTYINAIAVLGNLLFGFCQVGGQPATSSVSIGWNIGTAPAIGPGQAFAYKNNVVISNGALYFQTNSLGTLRVTTSSQQVYLRNNVYADYFLGFDTSGNLLIVKDNVYSAYNYTQGFTAYTFTPTGGSVMIVNSSPLVVAADSGLADIFTYQTFLNQINLAFQSAFVSIQSTYTANNGPTNAPNIVYNASTRLFSLICEGQYTEVDTSGNPKFQIFLNPTLYSKFLFPKSISQPYDGLNAILIQNNGTNAVVGNGSASLPQFISMQQEDSTIYAFYDLVRIIVGTTLIPVSGDGEGKTFSTTGFVSNSSINMITDIVPDTTSLTPGSVIIYVPEGILRWYNLYAQQPFSRVDLTLSYETKDGTLYPIPIVTGEFFSVKLEFKKGPGDF
jgi:hypothetical protein